MSTFVGLRPLNRSAKIGVGIKDVVNGKTTWVNLDNQRASRDLSRHSTLGQFVQTQPGRFQLDTAQVGVGGVVTPRTASVTLDFSAVTIQYITPTDNVYTKGALASLAAGTQAVTPSATLNLIAAIGLNTGTPASPAIVALHSTVTSVPEDRFVAGDFSKLHGEAATNVPAIGTTADRTWLALVWVPRRLALTTPFGVAATGVFTATAHGFKVGDPVWLDAQTGATAGLSLTTLYYVNTVPSANSFTVSATLGGPTLTWTTDLSAGSIQRQILSSNIQDIRP